MSNPSSLQFTVGLCTYNRATLLPALFDTLIQQTLDPDRFEILVIDNNSTDNTLEVVNALIAAHPDRKIRYVLETQQGVSHARNRAYQEAQAEYLVYIDDDELAYPDWLEQFADMVQRYPEPVILAGRILVKTLTAKPDWMTEYVEGWLGKYDYGNSVVEITPEAIRNREIAYPFAGNFAVKVNFLKEIGGFDPNLGRNKDQMLGGEETKVCIAALENGYKLIYSPFSIIEHLILPDRLTKDFLKEKHYMQGKSSAMLAKKPKKSPFRFLAGKAAYLFRLLPRLLSRQSGFETQLKLFFEMGVLSGYMQRHVLEG